MNVLCCGTFHIHVVYILKKHFTIILPNKAIMLVLMFLLIPCLTRFLYNGQCGLSWALPHRAVETAWLLLAQMALMDN